MESVARGHVLKGKRTSAKSVALQPRDAEIEVDRNRDRAWNTFGPVLCPANERFGETRPLCANKSARRCQHPQDAQPKVYLLSFDATLSIFYLRA